MIELRVELCVKDSGPIPLILLKIERVDRL